MTIRRPSRALPVLLAVVAPLAACEWFTPPDAVERARAAAAAQHRVTPATAATAGVAGVPAGTRARGPARVAEAALGARDAGAAPAREPREGQPGARTQAGPREEGSRSGTADAPAPPAADSLVAVPPAPPADEPAVAEPERDPRPASERFPRPPSVRGLYVNAWAAGSSARMEVLLDIARRTEINALVIDIKDASGYVSHRTQVPLAREVGADTDVRIRDLPGLLARLESEGIYPIARIVVVKDPVLVAARPDLAVADTAGGVWVDSKGDTWLNPYAREVWDYHVALAREVALLGFPEIQFDYVRFPDAPPADLDRAVFAGARGQSKAEAIRVLLLHTREALDSIGVSFTADVFGVTTSAASDVGIGQYWESFIDAVDVALPMVYPSHYYPGSFGFGVPNAYPYEIVKRALADALRRSAKVEGAGRTIPWLQDFSLGEPAYAAAEVRAQIQAAYDAGIDEWILWNPGSHYTVGALEPEGGFVAEPVIRVAGVLAPVSRRHEVIDSMAAVRASVEAARAAAARETARADSAAADASSPTGPSAPAPVEPTPVAPRPVEPTPVEPTAPTPPAADTLAADPAAVAVPGAAGSSSAPPEPQPHD